MSLFPAVSDSATDRLPVEAVQSNRVITICYRLTLDQKRLLLLAVSKLRSAAFKFPPDNLGSRQCVVVNVSVEDWLAAYPSDSNAWQSLAALVMVCFLATLLFTLARVLCISLTGSMLLLIFSGLTACLCRLVIPVPCICRACLMSSLRLICWPFLACRISTLSAFMSFSLGSARQVFFAARCLICASRSTVCLSIPKR